MIDPIQTATWSNTIIGWAIGALSQVPSFIIPPAVNQAMTGWLSTIQTFVNGPGWAKIITWLNQQATS